MRKLAITAILVATPALAALAAPAFAHCYSVWRYPWPQRCGAVSHVVFHAPKEDKSYFVEITAPPVPLPAIEQIDQRTPEQIADQKEHDAAVAAHKGEINKAMILLHAEEDARAAAGIETK